MIYKRDDSGYNEKYSLGTFNSIRLTLKEISLFGNITQNYCRECGSPDEGHCFQCTVYDRYIHIQRGKVDVTFFFLIMDTIEVIK